MKGHDKLCRILNSFRSIGKAKRGWHDVPGDQIVVCVITLEERIDSAQFRQADSRIVHDFSFELTDESGVKANKLGDK
jgi:hypothetical protein